LLTKDPEQRPSIQELIEEPIIRDALDTLEKELEIIKKDEDSLKLSVPEVDSKIKDLDCPISLID
jgi:serine/threonine protein kinase